MENQIIDWRNTKSTGSLVESSHVDNTDDRRVQLQQDIVSHLIGLNPSPPSALSVNAGDDFIQEVSQAMVNNHSTSYSAIRNQQHEGESFRNVFKKPHCLSFEKTDLSSCVQESQNEKKISLALLIEVGVDPRAKR